MNKPLKCREQEGVILSLIHILKDRPIQRSFSFTTDGETLRSNDEKSIRWVRKSWISKGGSHYESSAQCSVSSGS